MTVCAPGPGPKCVPVNQIKDNLEVRRIAGRHLGRRQPVTRATLLRWRHHDEFPAPIRKTAAGSELWDARDVRGWLRDRKPTD